MATIIFYEKPGCINNSQQKNLLIAAGHQVIAKNLLTEPWTTEHLLPFLQTHPVATWFNRAAPKVKSGEIIPEHFSAEQALALLLLDPLLIRRPLLQIDNNYYLGFDPNQLATRIELQQTTLDLETCQQTTACPHP